MAEIPEAYDAWLAAGAEAVRMGRSREESAVRSLRETFERALRITATSVDGLTLMRGHVDEVTTRHGRVDGIRVDGIRLAADLVVDASGRIGKATRSLRPPPSVGDDTGVAYVAGSISSIPAPNPVR